MNREKLAWALGLVLLTVAAFRSPSAAQRDSDYLFVRTLVDINRQVSAHYVENVDQAKLEQAAINGMLSQLDTYSMYVPPDERERFDRALEGTLKGVGIQLHQLPGGEVEVVTPIDGSPAFRAGILPGDIILKVNGESIQGLALPDVIKKVGGQAGSEVTLSVRHVTGETADLKMRREEIIVPTVKGYQRKDDHTWDYFVCKDPRIAYVRLTQFTPSTLDAMKAVTEELLRDGMRALILDLRWNPGGDLRQAVGISDLFLREGTVVSVRGRNRPEEVYKATDGGTLPWFPMIVLVNEHSASAAEIVAGCLKDNRRAAILGTRTYGKGSVQELIPLEGNNGELKLTVAYYYLPSGRLVHKKKDAADWGVDPQIPVPMDEQTLKKVMEERTAYETFRRPASGPSTQPSPDTADIQIRRAVDTLILQTIFQDHPDKARQTAKAPAAD